MFRLTSKAKIVRSLFNLCIDAIQDAMKTGILVNLDDLPTDLRQLIFFKFHSYCSDEDEAVDDLPPSLLRHQFFNQFEHIGLLDFRDCDQHNTLVSTILAEIERPGSSLASTLVSLRLRLCFVERRPQYSIWQWLGFVEKPPFEVDIYRLIAACRNLRRLFLERCSTCWNGLDFLNEILSGTTLSKTSLRNCDYALGEIMDALGAGGVSRARLEELTLREFYTFDIGNRFSALESLQGLQLHKCHFSPVEFLRLVAPCRKTLLTLCLESTIISGPEIDRLLDLIWFFRQITAYVSTECLASGVVDLPALTSLTINKSRWYADYFKPSYDTIKRCLLSYETLRRLRNGKVCLYDTSRDEMMQRLADCLPTDVEVAFVIGDSLNFQRFSLAHNLFGQRIVELRFEFETARFPRLAEYGEMVDQLTSIRVLVMRADSDHDEHFRGDRFLRRFLSDARRAGQLQRLKIRWDLQAETLQLLFRHCVNLERLRVYSHSLHLNELPEITDDHLKIWAAKGAKPKLVDFGYRTNITVDGVDHLLRNCGGELIAPGFLDERGRFFTEFIEFH